MPKRPTFAGEAIVANLHDSLCRRIRLARERIRLSEALEVCLSNHPAVLCVAPKGLEDLLSYRCLSEEGLAQATVRHREGTVFVLAAASRVWRRPKLKRRLLAIKRDARRLGRRVLLVSGRGLRREQTDQTRRRAAAKSEPCAPRSAEISLNGVEVRP